MTTTLHGKVHGKTIHFDQDLGVPDGQDVEVQIRVIPTEGKWGDDILRTEEPWRMIPTGTASWKKSTRPVKLSAGLRRVTSDAPSRHQHLLGSHASSGWSGPSFLPVRRRACHFNDRPCGTVLRRIQASESPPTAGSQGSDAPRSRRYTSRGYD